MPCMPAKLLQPLPETLAGIARNHVASFDYFVQHGLPEVVKRLGKVTPASTRNQRPYPRAFTFGLMRLALGKPWRDGDSASSSRDPRLFPRECRESSSTYKAPMSATLGMVIWGIWQCFSPEVPFMYISSYGWIRCMPPMGSIW